MNDLYEALEMCLQDIEQGADIDTVLFRYPDLADELRPILEASRNASSLAVPVPSVEVVRRNRARVLQRAAQMRESRRSSRRIWLVSLRRVVVTLAVVTILFVSGTGLVRAASTTVPGDQLYPVKRTWEDVLVLFAFNSQQRDALEVEHENERIQELQEVFAEKRSVEVEFAGRVTSQNGTSWMIAGVPVVISAQTEIQGQGIVVGSAVQIKGHTQADGSVVAEKVELLPPGAILPNVGEEQEFEENDHENLNPQQEDSSSGVEQQEPKVEATATSASGYEQNNESLKEGSQGGDSGSQEKSGSGGDSSGSHDGGSQDGGHDSGSSDSGSGGGED